jgi:hypothetical protein
VSRGAVHRAALLLLLSGAALIGAGCGSGSRATQTGLRLQREDLIATARALAGARGEVAAEVKTTKAAWPLVANGLPASPTPAALATIEAAARQAGSLKLPGLFTELRARGLTGPASGLAGEFRSYAGLSARGWQLIAYSLNQVGHGSSGAASFARENSALYVESVYDAHFGLAQTGKKLLAGYEKLGGPSAFGSSLTQDEVERLAGAYSEAGDRLHPHSGVKLGS